MAMGMTTDMTIFHALAANPALRQTDEHPHRGRPGAVCMGWL
jgi:hypothetical protein